MAFQLNNSSITLFVLLILSLYSSASAQEVAGTATYTVPPYTPSVCYGNQDYGEMVALASPEIYNGGAGCGQYYIVGCVGGMDACRGDWTVVVMVTGVCKSEPCQSLALSYKAFNDIAEPQTGYINISYKLYE
ncbi:hypothetical protein JRO89_XS03G0003000 [Xanthoceras sorbifolium]|uniref:Expansin-like EG45 domain-containing protein n=1 Tax=Xanthoceras sorbifolium TaxID=99658 RepID=A0ABQ8I7Y2_9ROSI|nr:hypothetical protein JRO89_XS03G0003000 [Xanthoceras sorbifolium]